jgi:hypothetical protein
LASEPNIALPCGSPRSRRLFPRAGIAFAEVGVSELAKRTGVVHANGFESNIQISLVNGFAIELEANEKPEGVAS